MRDAGPAGSAQIDALVTELQRDERISAAFLFGSAARDALRPDSDLDVGVIYADAATSRAAERALRETLGRLGTAAGRDVHVVELERAGPTLRFQVFRRGRVLFDRDPRRTARLIEKTMRERFDWEYARSVIDAAMAKWAEKHAPAAPERDDG